MRRAVVLACLLACAAGLPAASLSAEEPFAGTWRVDPLKGTIHGKPQRIELKDGTYRCFSCTPPIEVKADGLKHPIKSDLEDGLSVKVESDRAVTSTYFVGDRRTYEVKATVSSDGQTRMQDVVNWAPDGTTVTGKSSRKRIGAEIEGAHPLSGTWDVSKIVDVSDAGREYTYAAVPGGLKATDPTGLFYEAKFDGKRYPVKGVDGIDQVRIRRIGANAFEEKYWYKGKVTLTNILTLTPDRDHLKVDWTAPDFSGTDFGERK